MKNACAVLYCHVLPLRHFYTLYDELRDFQGGGVVEHKMCVLIFSTFLSETFLVLRRIHLDINIYWSSCKVPVIRVRF